MEEINALFGDEVVIHLSEATEKQRKEMAIKILAEDEGREYGGRVGGGGDSVSTTTALEASYNEEKAK